MMRKSASIGALALLAGLAPPLFNSPARADEVATYVLTLENDAFAPADLKIPAGKPFVLKVVNKEKAGVEIEAKDLKIEKVVAAGGEVIAHVKAQKPGRYLLVNEYKEDTVKIDVVVE
jgi:Cupredoxin-like domain